MNAFALETSEMSLSSHTTKFITTSSQLWSGEASDPMEHHEAIEMMASERYLLDELTPELRDAYEEHFFGCSQCADDVRFGAVFVDQAKTVLPTMESFANPARVDTATSPIRASARTGVPEKREWFAWLRPAFLVPAFACLIAIIGYQNLVTYPALELAANEPQILPTPVVLHGATRSGIPVVHADLLLGSTVTVPLSPNPAFASYKFDFYDSKGKVIWSRTLQSSAASEDSVTFWLPSRTKQDTYKLAITGITATGENIPIQQQLFDVQRMK